ncbi:Uncharacterized conserved protein YdeI, YjbR/CyaY-like superfamily, DUF1801 family [Cognatiyoonia koreensis]|uniref:Uncharacterized conserved protein YdeI, YjbR/CyaY-like superfamily, DUF1801 family n=1 Tax=Cognatiyoonia koreensis TaxID=364200 RepID=A0A1I0NPE7_9RHOB|nr:YdeI/OmpD-associated family protein [Cognatiyoonia koreensis]SEW03264.1 Uncharacterized conserved protein YdeI, YjbR/CyaY-like superfamily, DUF1801 family [Cognatiyoonia koreensis]
MMITDVDDYFTKGCGRCSRFATPECSAHVWGAGLDDLRTICRDLSLTETVKWGHPCYMHADRNIAIIGAFRDYFRLSFFNAGLMKDPEGVLETQGPNSQTPGMIRFTENGQVRKMEQVLRAYLREAMAYADAGMKAPKTETALDWPEELGEALDSDLELAEAFDNLTPGRQKSYILNLNGAKKPETRMARIAKFRDKIIAGKGALDR